ncbi:MAG: DNA mismatch repair protein MutS [Treponema sp.]|nr:DNA mismatch repair protein MutS [Treponema sp.]
MSKITPLMIQYQSIKDEYQDEVLFFRLGDFYEMFNDDAVEVSRLLNLTLTRRGDNPMCGIPYHASKVYIARLLRLGKKIAICEQVGEVAQGKGLTERKVVEVITPGTVIEEEYLEQSIHNYLASLSVAKISGKTFISFAAIDVSTGDFLATSWNFNETSTAMPREIGRLQPRELLISNDLENDNVIKHILSSNPSISVSWYPAWHFSFELSYKRLLKQFEMTNLRSFGLTETSPEILSAGFLIEYLVRMSNTMRNNKNFSQISNIKIYKETEYVLIDDSSRRNLELTNNLNDGSTKFTLLETINHCVTPMGNRLLRFWIMTPLLDLNKIKKRQNHITAFVNNSKTLSSVRKILSSILDIERLASRIAMEKAHAKDILALKQSLQNWINVRNFTDNLGFWGSDINLAMQCIEIIEQSIIDEPSTLLNEGRLIKDGFSEELDHWKKVQNNFNEILENYLEEERTNTGISNLKIRYNRIIGYYIEVTKGKIDSVPSHFILRRALVNGDRYTTNKLQELEHELLTAGEKVIEIEKSLFLNIREKLAMHINYFMQVATEISYTDVCASLAHAAIIQNWVCPEVENSLILEIEEGRHPVVELHLPNGQFVPNNTQLSTKPFALITGPNMAGKSTYLRQNALIVLLAQIGSFVPATKARIGIVDSIFCRVGASDNLARGESTFLVEMIETAHILHSATEKSLVIMDEVGRGTSTEDGLSIAWAVSEYLLNSIKCKTFFATHYHELTRLFHPSICMLYLEVLEEDGKIIFLRRIKEGAAENSYGIHVAQLAGIPKNVINRATEILESLQKKATYTESAEKYTLSVKANQNLLDETLQKKSNTFNEIGLFNDEELILNEILSIDTDKITPLEALQKVARWKKELSGK